MNQKPSVFPTAEQRAQASHDVEKAKIEAYEAEKAVVTNQIYSASQTPNDTPQGHVSAVEMMRQRTAQQMAMRNQNGDYNGVVYHPELAETPRPQMTKEQYDQMIAHQRTEEQIRLRDEALARNQNQTNNYQKQFSEASTRKNDYVTPGQNMNQNQYQNPQDMGGYHINQPPVTPPPTVPPVNNGYMGQNYGKNPSNINSYLFELSQPNYNSPFDVIPLPSQGKTYRNKKTSIRVSYLTTADENILTSPNLLQSGEFLEILLNRKILEPDLRYKDLLMGDRNAIMIWLRATGYGEMYPVTLFDEKDVPFDTEINLNDLGTKHLGAEPDEEGLFYFQFPLCKAQIKFKMLTCGDTDDIERMVEADKANNVPVNNTNTYTMERMIVEINGRRDRNEIREFANAMRIRDAKAFEEYVDKIGCGIDLNITVGTPGGGSVKTFLPLNLKFFWPNL